MSWFFVFRDRLALGLLYLCFFLVFFGGLQIRFRGGSVEVGEINLWGAALSILLASLSTKAHQSRSWNRLTELIRWGKGAAGHLPKFIILAFGLLFLSHVIRFLTFNTNLWDMGIVHSSLMFPFEGSLLSCPICRNESYMGEHLSFTLILVAPLTAFLQSDLFVFLLQKIIVLGALYLFCTRGPLRNRPDLHLWWFFLVLANEGLRAGLLFDFREDILIYAFFLGAAASIWKGSVPVLFLCAGLALLSKENAFASVAMISGTVLWAQESPWTRRSRFWIAFTLLVTSVLYMWVSFKFFMPHFQGLEGQTGTALLDRFPGMGRTPEELVQNFLTQPFRFIWTFSSNVFTPRALTYFFLVSAVALFWGWRAWPWLLPAFPGIAFNLLSASATQRSLAFHYDLINVSWMAVAIAFGMLKSSRAPSTLDRNLRIAVCLALISFGRSPLYYVFENLTQYGSRLKAGFASQFLEPTEPLAADQFVMSAFSHVKNLRFFFPSIPVNGDRRETISRFVAANPVLNRYSEGRDARDARTWALRQDEPDQSWLIEELKRAGGRELYRSHPPGEGFALVLIETSRPIYEIWCEQDGICKGAR